MLKSFVVAVNKHLSQPPVQDIPAQQRPHCFSVSQMHVKVMRSGMRMALEEALTQLGVTVDSVLLVL